MSAAPLPENEADRVTALRAYEILDTPAEYDFDDIARIAGALCHTPIALVSLIDETRQWFKCRIGLNVGETSRDQAFCAHAILQPDVMVVSDTRLDARFVDNPLVTGWPHIRFYAGAPLVMPSGHALGTLCVLDRQPRELSALQMQALQTLARQVVTQLELRRKVSEQTRALAVQQQLEKDRRDGQARFEAFMNASPLVAFMKDRGGRYLYVNAPFERLFAATQEDIWGMTDYDWLPREVAEQVRANDEIVRVSGRPLEITEMVPTPDGVAHIWASHKFPFVGPGGDVCVGGVANDITASKQAEDALRRSEARLKEAQGIACIGSWDFDIASGAIVWSEETFRLLDYDPAQGTPTLENLMHRYHPDDVPMHLAVIQKCSEDGLPWAFDIRAVMNDGSLRWFHALGQAACDAQGKPTRMFGTLRDITEAKAHQEQRETANARLEAANSELAAVNARLEALAMTDGLTGLKNHRSFQDKLAGEFERSRRYDVPLALLMLDVDQFKLFNDAFGHPAGDEVLKRVATVLQEEARTTDFVARYGGEEFALILPETTAEGARATAERIRAALAGQVWERRAITVSIGIATLHPAAAAPISLVEEADAALYRSKQNGRNRVTLHTFSAALSEEPLIFVPAALRLQ